MKHVHSKTQTQSGGLSEWTARCVCTRVSADCVAGRIGLRNFLWEPTAAGNGGDEWRAETKLMRLIHEFISALDLRRKTNDCSDTGRWTLWHKPTYVCSAWTCCDLRGLKEKNPPVGCLQTEDVWLLGVIGCWFSQRVMHAHHLLYNVLIPSIIILTHKKEHKETHNHKTQEMMLYSE